MLIRSCLPLLLAAACLALTPQSGHAQGAAAPAKPAAPAPAPAAPPPPAPKKEEPQPERLGGAQGWNAWSFAVRNGKVCYVVGDPTKKEPAAKRDRVNALVTHNTAEKTTNVVSLLAGYTFGEKAEVELDVDGRKFNLFTARDTAWARDAATDRAIVDALSKGKQATVKGAPPKGAASVDTYSLAGFGQALALIDKACNVKR